MNTPRNRFGRFVSVKVMDERIEALRSAGFSFGYASRDAAKSRGYVTSTMIDDEWYQGHRILTVTGEDHPAYGTAYVCLERVARGEDSYGQDDSVARSNFRSLVRDYPDTFTPRSYSNVDALGAFVADLDEDMISLLVGLVEQYPVYDDSDHSELEQEDIGESWAEWLSSEVYREMSDPLRTMWFALGDETVTDLWWWCVSDEMFGPYPEHRGCEVAWGPIKDLAAAFREVLIRAYVNKRQGIRLEVTGYDGVVREDMSWVGAIAEHRRSEREAARRAVRIEGKF